MKEYWQMKKLTNWPRKGQKKVPSDQLLAFAVLWAKKSSGLN
jgi:hypothetical protein